MKKLIAMIGAVAMSFGLFADATEFGASFDAPQEPGVDGTTYTSSEAGWSGLTDPLTLKVYATEGETPYEYSGSNSRSTMFEDDNTQYLPLETTASEELSRTVTEGGENIFIDQLVKFTGFEDPQTNLVAGTKIAVWMSEYVVNEETEETETNLYATVGNDEQIGQQIAVKIAGDYELGKWHRLTIKAIKNIYTSDEKAPQAGFLIYVDGVQRAIAADDPSRDDLITVDYLTAEAAAAKAQYQLFPAVATGSAALASVGYKGIGAIDDVTISETAPEFAAAVDVTVTLIPGAIIVVKDKDGNEIPGDANVYSIPRGAFTVTYTAAPDYILTEKTIPHNTVELVNDTVDDSDEVEPQEVIVEVNYNNETTEKFADEQDALAAVDAYTKKLENRGKQVVITFKKAVTKTAYAFAEGTIIVITDDSETAEDQVTSTWTISNGDVTFNQDLGNYKAIVLEGDITLTFAGKLGEGSSIFADTIVAEDGAIELDPLSVGVTTKSDLSDAFADVEGFGLVANPEEDDYKTYFLAPVHAYYADLYIEGAMQDLKVYLGEEGQKFFEGVEVDAIKPGVIDATVEPDFAGNKTYYVSKLVLIGEEGNSECTFEYNGTTLTKVSGDLEVTVSEGNILSYTVVTGAENPFGQVWLKEYTPVTTFTVTATPAENDEYTTQYKIGDGTLTDYTEPVVANIGETVTIQYTANAGWRITAGGEVEKEETATVDAPTVAKVFTISTTGGANADVVRNPADGKGIAGETVTITATALETFTYDGVTLGEGWAYVDDDKTNIVKTVTISDDETITVPGAVAKAAPVKPTDWTEVTEDTPLSNIVPAEQATKLETAGVKADAVATWAAKHSVAIGTAEESGIDLEAFALDVAPEKTSKEEAVAALIDADLLAAIVANGTTTDLADLNAKYPLLTFTVIESTKLPSTDTAKFFQLQAVLK